VNPPGAPTLVDNTFKYIEGLKCGEGIALKIANACTQVYGVPSCLPGSDPPASSNSNDHQRRNLEISGYSSPRLSKRKPDYCRESPTNPCEHIQDANLLGYCPNGYREESVQAHNKLPGTICRKPCTDQEKQNCRGHECTYNLNECRKYPGSASYCSEALLKCGTPVTMNKDKCDQYLLGAGDRVPRKAGHGYPGCPKCVSYSGGNSEGKGGKCTLNSTALDAYKKSLSSQGISTKYLN
jgi:hypothetical protein